jgi:hypothetical protein
MSKFLPNQSVSDLKSSPGTRETNVITMPAVGDATQGDYVICYNAAGVSKAFYIDIDSDGTEPTGTLYVAATTKTALAYKNAVQETFVLTCPAMASATQGDFFVVYDDAGNSTAVWLDIDADGTEPAGTLYTATDAQIEVNIATGDNATAVAGKVHTAISGNISDITFTDNSNGTITVLLDNAGPATNAFRKNADEDGNGSFTVGTITKGVLAITAETGGALLAAATPLTDTTFTDNADGTVTFAASDIGNATNAVPKNTNDAGAGSITVSATDGTVAKFPYESPGDSPTTRKVTPDSF